MGESNQKLGKVIKIDDGRIERHLDEIVRGTVEETLNRLLEAEADQICGAKRYERSPDRKDTRAGHYDRTLHTKAGEVNLKMPKLRKLPFETAIIGANGGRSSNHQKLYNPTPHANGGRSSNHQKLYNPTPHAA